MYLVPKSKTKYNLTIKFSTVKIEVVNHMGMELERLTHESCTADIGLGDTWATVFSIVSEERGKGHAQQLLTEAKKHYENAGKVFGSSIALNPGMRHILQKLGIKEYTMTE